MTLEGIFGVPLAVNQKTYRVTVTPERATDVDEVLDRQPAATRGFLLRTSILARMTGPLCDAVTGPADGMSGSAVLEMFERRTLLLVPLDDHRRWYR